jgi:hypothetical protein
MKTHVVRSPETDRYRFKVPEGAQDLPTTPHGFGTNPGGTVVDNTKDSTYSLTLGTDIVNMGPGGGGTTLATDVAGLFLVIVTVEWDWAVGVPANVDRSLGVCRVNTSLGTLDTLSIIRFVSTVGDSHMDQITALVRLAVGDTLAPYSLNTNGGNGTIVKSASLYAVLVAP